MSTVLLAIDACTQLDRILPAALLIASEQGSALLGMFAQDRRLLRGAALPFTTEVGAHSAVCYPVTALAIEKRVLRVADEMRKCLASAAERQQLPFEFQVCAGSISEIATDAEASVILPGWSTNLSVTQSCAGPFGRHSSANAIVVIDDASPSSAHAITAARRLTTSTGTRQLVILTTLPAGVQPEFRPLALTKSEHGERVIPVDSTEQLIQQIRMLRPAVILLGREQYRSSDRFLKSQLALIPSPLALVDSSW